MPDTKPDATEAIATLNPAPAEARQGALAPDAEGSADTLTFPSIVGLELGYNAAEDRVVMLARLHQSEMRVILLTRRMMGQLLGHYAELMRRTSPAVARAPSAHQYEVLQMEHVSALMSAPGGGAGSAPESNVETGAEAGSGAKSSAGDGAPQSFHVVTEIRMQVNDSHLSVGFVGPRRHVEAQTEAAIDPIAAATMDRAEAHRFLAMLNDKALEASWSLESICPWLTSAGLAPSTQIQVN